jgi:outer membrane lipoprotein-sorting protein
MKTRLICWLAVMTMTAQAWAQSAPALPFKTAHWRCTIEANGMSIPSETWFHAPGQFRTVTQAAGHDMISIVNGNDIFIFPSGATMGMKLDRATVRQQAKGIESDDLIQQVRQWKTRGKKAGSETLNGRPCDIYEISETVNEQDTKGKVWLWTKNDFPLRAALQIGSLATVMTMNEVELDVPVTDEMFRTPKGMQFQDLGGLMKVLPQLQQLQNMRGLPGQPQ